MKNFTRTKYFLHKIDNAGTRFDVEYLDPYHNDAREYLEKIQQKTNYEIRSLGELFNTISGKTPKKYLDDGIPIIKLRNVTGNNIDWHTDCIEQEFFEKHKESHLQINDVLLTSTGDGTIGRTDLFNKNISTMADVHVIALRAKNRELLPQYLLYFLRSKLGQIQIRRYIVGHTGQTELNSSDIKNISIIYPKKLLIQRDIIKQVVGRERSAQNKKKQAEKELAKINRLLITKLDFIFPNEPPQFYTKKIAHPFERIDFEFHNPFHQEYEKSCKNNKYPFTELGKLVTFSSESINPQYEQPDQTFLYVDIGNIDTTWGVMDSESMFGYEATSARMRRLIHQGQILVSTTRPTRRAIAIVPKKLEGQICSTGFAVLECGKSIDRRYLFHVLRSSIMTPQFERYSTGSGYPEINKRIDLPTIKIPCPENNVMQEIIKQIDSIVDKAHFLHDQFVSERQKAVDIFEGFLSHV